MNTRFLAYALGKLLQVFSLVMMVPAGIALQEAGFSRFPATLGDSRVLGFIVAILSSAATGTLGVIWGRPADRLSARDGFSVVTFGWLAFSLFGAFPLFVYFHSTAPGAGLTAMLGSFTDAFFEVMSGFTTTGATILTDIESVPRGILFWRSLTHWLGGMGIVTLGLVVFPAFGVAAYQMFRGEMPGPSKERLRPRMAQTATILWGVYALLTLLEMLLLFLGGMSPFDAICHSFGTISCGGFSTRNASIGAFDSAYFDAVVTLFMFLAGVNFFLHYRLFFFRDPAPIRENSEFHFYALVLCGATVAAVAILVIRGIPSADEIATRFRFHALGPELMAEKIQQEQLHIRSIFQAVRYAIFQVISITTSTGVYNR